MHLLHWNGLGGGVCGGDFMNTRLGEIHVDAGSNSTLDSSAWALSLLISVRLKLQ